MILQQYMNHVHRVKYMMWLCVIILKPRKNKPEEFQKKVLSQHLENYNVIELIKAVDAKKESRGGGFFK
jgi:hypothetical protein